MEVQAMENKKYILSIYRFLQYCLKQAEFEIEL